MDNDQGPPISLKSFLDDYRNILKNDVMSQSSTENDIQRALNLLDDLPSFENLKERCSIAHADHPDDPFTSQFLPGITERYRKGATVVPKEGHKLRTLNKLLEVKNGKMKNNPFNRSVDSYKLVLPPVYKADDEICDFYNDIIVTVRFYRPVRATHVGQSLEKPIFAEEFECLGSNLLTELRDMISCICNDKQFFDISQNPMSSSQCKKSTDPGYFFIGNTFYNDKRNPDNMDYSETVRRWAKGAIGLKSEKFQVANMEETRFIDLTVSLGCPQLYQHHGNCEHIFVFSQIEVITPGAICTRRSQYPRLRSFSLFNNILCNMCGIEHYSFIVEKCDRQLHDPAYLCGKCFYSYHYVDGKKIGKFKAFCINDYENIREDSNGDHGDTDDDDMADAFVDDENDEIN